MTIAPFLGAARQEIQPRSPQLLVELSLFEQKRRERDLLSVRLLTVFARDTISVHEHR